MTYQRTEDRSATHIGGNTLKRILRTLVATSLVLGSSGSLVFANPVAGGNTSLIATQTSGSIAIAGNNTIQTNGHETLTLQSTDAYDVTTPITSNVTWSVDNTSGQASTDANGNFTATATGTYDVIATYNGQSYIAKVIVSNGTGVAVGYRFTSDKSTLLYGDPSGQNTITVTAVDASGNPATNYSGDAAISLTDIPNNSSASSTTNGHGLYIPPAKGDSYLIRDNLAYMNQKVNDFNVDLSTGKDTLHFQNGKAVFQLSPSPLGDTYKVTITDKNRISPLKTAVYIAKSVSATPTTIDMTVDKSYYYLYPVYANQVHAYIKISFSDGNGVTQFSSGKTIPVKLTLTGPGSFSAHSKVTKQTIPVGLFSYGAMREVEVFCPMDSAGTVKVNASAKGLTGSSVSFSTYKNTKPASIGVTRASNGEYTVTLLDTSGQRFMTAKDTLEISDNAKMLGDSPITYVEGDVHLYDFQSDFRMFGGTFQFQAQSQSRPVKPVTLTILDKTRGFKTTTQFAGPPVFPGTESSVSLALEDGSHSVVAGQTVTVEAQVTDQYGKPFRAANERLNFYIGDSTKIGVHFANGADGITARTDENGFAIISVTVPSNAKSESRFFIHAISELSQTPLATLSLTVK